MGSLSSAPPRNTPHSPAISKPPSAASTPSGSAASGWLRAMPRSIASILRCSPASESPAPRPVISATGRPSSTLATALDVVVLPMPISPVASSWAPVCFCARTSAMPAAIACTACARVIAGPVVKSAVPAAIRQSAAPGTGAPAMPISTGTTSQWAAAAMRQTLVRRAVRFSSTARVTEASVWLTPCATTPLSAQSTSTARRLTSGTGSPVSAAASSTMASSRPSPPKGFASAAQWAWAAARAASSGGVTAASRFFSSFSVMMFPLYNVRLQPQSASAAAYLPSRDAENPRRDVHWQSRTPTAARLPWQR